MRASIAALLGIVIGLAVSLLAASRYVPPQLSNSWGGMSLLASQAIPVTAPVDLLEGPCRVLVIAAPQLVPSSDDLAYLREFVQLGGVIVIASSGHVANAYLNGLGVNVTVLNYTVLDPLLALNSSGEVSATIRPPFNASGSLVLVSPSPLLLGDGSKPLAVSSPLAVANSSHGNLTGPFSLAAYERVGEGAVIVIGSPYAFINGLLPYNGRLLTNLSNGSKTCLAYFAWALPPAYRLSLSLRRLLSTMSPTIMTPLAAAALGVAAYYYPRRNPGKASEELDEARHRLPMADEALLERLVKERAENLGPSQG